MFPIRKSWRAELKRKIADASLALSQCDKEYASINVALPLDCRDARLTFHATGTVNRHTFGNAKPGYLLFTGLSGGQGMPTIARFELYSREVRCVRWTEEVDGKTYIWKKDIYESTNFSTLVLRARIQGAWSRFVGWLRLARLTLYVRDII